MATRVFLLSADEKAVHVITQILDEQDFRFEHSSDATFTLKRLAGQHFDILVVDCDNADSAMQVFNSARASQLNKGAIAVAIVEGKAGVPNAFRLGASLVLTKPVSLEQTRNTLRTAVGMTRKDSVEARPVVVPPLATVPAPISHPPLHVPVAPATVAVPPPSITPAVNTSALTPAASHPANPVAPPVTAIAPPAPVVPAAPAVPSAQPLQAFPPKPADGPTLVKPIEIAAPKAPAPLNQVASAIVEATTEEKSVPLPAVSKPQPLQISETHVVKAEEEIIPAEVEKQPALQIESKPASLSSAMLDATESAVAMAELETALKAVDSKAPGAVEMFPPEQKPVDEPSSDTPAPESEDSAATLRAGAVPAFGGLGKQPFAGIEPSNNSKRGVVIGGVVAMVAAAAFAGAWFYAPGFKSAVTWEYAHLLEQLHGSQPKSTSAQVAINPPVVSSPSTPAPVGQTSTPDTPESGVTASTSASTVSSQPLPNPSLPATTSSVAPSSATTAAAPAVKSLPKPAPAPTATPTANNAASLVNTSASSVSAATTKPSELFEVPEDYADDQVIHRIHPVYPKSARARKLQGSVVLQAIIDKQGKVDSLQLVSGDPLLAQAAADAVKQWRYKPYSHNGDPVEFQTRVTVDFKLPDSAN